MVLHEGTCEPLSADVASLAAVWQRACGEVPSAFAGAAVRGWACRGGLRCSPRSHPPPRLLARPPGGSPGTPQVHRLAVCQALVALLMAPPRVLTRSVGRLDEKLMPASAAQHAGRGVGAWPLPAPPSSLPMMPATSTAPGTAAAAAGAGAGAATAGTCARAACASSARASRTAPGRPGMTANLQTPDRVGLHARGARLGVGTEPGDGPGQPAATTCGWGWMAIAVCAVPACRRWRGING